MRKYLLLSILFCVGSTFAQDLVLEELPLENTPSEPSETVFTFDKKETPKKEGTLDEFYSILDNQSKNLKDLTERLEQMEHRLKLAEDKLELVNQDISLRISELEAKQNQPPVIIDKNSDKERYDFAYSLLKEKNYSQAEKEFLAFIKEFEKSDLISNALYWLGETYYVQGQYEQAVGQFADVFTKHPQSNKAPDALLKMGLSMVSLNKQKEACTAFIALPNEYPKAPEELKKRAQEEAKKNKCS